MAQAWPADTLQAFDDALFALVLEFELEGFLERLAFHGNVRHVPFLLQDIRDALLQPGVRHLDGRQQRTLGVADPRQHIGNRVNHIYSFPLTSWPWSRPGSARS